MFGNLGSRNLFEVRELNYFSSSANKSVGNPSKAHKKAMSSSSYTNRTALYSDFGWQKTSGRISQTTKEKKLTWSPERKAEEKKKAEAHFAVNVSANQQRLSDTYGITTYDKSGNISTTPQTPESSWKTHNVKGSPIVVSNKIVGSPTLRETVEAQNKATQEFKAKWHGIKENGVIVQEPTATRTDTIQALLTSNNEHFGTDTRNLEQYLSERDYDISSIIAGETTVPDDIFRPEKKTTYREMSKQLTEKLDRISNYEKAKGKNAVQRNVSYSGIKGSEYIQLKDEVAIIQEHLDNESAQVLKTQDEDIIRDVVAKTYGVSDTVQNVSRTTKGTTPEKELPIPVYTTSFLPQILILAAGVLGIILLWRKLK